jgi:hypothetical protein
MIRSEVQYGPVPLLASEADGFKPSICLFHVAHFQRIAAPKNRESALSLPIGERVKKLRNSRFSARIPLKRIR